MHRIPLSLALAIMTAACGDPTPPSADAAVDSGARDAGPPDSGVDAGPPVEPRADYGEPGPHPVGNVRVVMPGRDGTRMLPVELWYPATEDARTAAEAGQSMAAFETGTANATALGDLLATAPDCVRAQTRSAAAPAAATDPATLPAVVFSHCHACTRFDVAEIAERLAGHGIVVAAPDHLGNTLWDARAGMVEPVGDAFLAVRASDASSVLDTLLDASAPEIPADLRGRVDPSRVGMMGHSFGAATTGLVITTDDRFAAAVAIAAPIAVLGGVRIADVHVPVLWIVAREDNSIGEIGNRLIRTEHMRATTPSWRLEVDDAGHWSFSDIDGLDAMFSAGCGEGVRQTVPDEPFTYLDPAIARGIAAEAATAFFAIHLLADPGGATALRRLEGSPAHVVE